MYIYACIYKAFFFYLSLYAVAVLRYLARSSSRSSSRGLEAKARCLEGTGYGLRAIRGVSFEARAVEAGGEARPMMVGTSLPAER